METYLVTAEEIDAMEGYAKTHFLNDSARRVNKSLGDLTGLKQLGFHIIEVQPGDESTETHVHYHEEECVYVLEGQAQATVGDRQFTVKAGDFLGYRAGGAAHSLKNTGHRVLRCIVAGHRFDHDVADYPRQGKRLFRNHPLPWNMVDISDIEHPVGGRKK